MNKQKVKLFLYMNNYKTIVSLVLALIYFLNNYAQNPYTQTGEYYVTYKSYKLKYKQKDSLGFMIKDNDTMIRISNNYTPKGIPSIYEYKDSTFLELYKKVAFMPIQKDSLKTKPMKYWKDDIRIFFSKSISKSVIKDVMVFAEEIDQEIDSLKISKVKTLEESNYIIYYDTDYEYSIEIKNKKKSDYWVTWNKKNQIERGYLRIFKKKMFSEKLTKQKIKKLFFGTLGWFNWSDELNCESYFSDCYSDNKHLTKLDIELLKYHYSYGIPKGMTMKSFEKMHKHFKRAMKRTNREVRFFHRN
jgi:hypothetical protein